MKLTIFFAVKRNDAGVQMLSRSLHEQIFKNCSFPPPDKAFRNISLDHLATHGLDRTQGSTLPSTEFTLPQLQGDNLLEHFHRIGSSSSEPYMSMAKTFTATTLPPRPENWDLQAGWIKYHHLDEASYSEHVPYPMHNGQPEQLLTFDVETMPKFHSYPVMACAASPNAWYAWISPWLLDPSSKSPEQLIPFGPSEISRIVVGHNVSYDRARIKEEYHLGGTKNRFLDTMSLHVAVKGISSHQRPAWNMHKKKREDEKEKKAEATEAVLQLMNEVQEQLDRDDIKTEQQLQLRQLLDNLTRSLPSLVSGADTDVDSGESEDSDPTDKVQQTWEDITSANSLADVAKLHCGIEISKAIRNDFMTHSPEEILAGITDYLSYCASDVFVTHSVYTKVLPEFFEACPHPVSFAGILTMGSGFLPVNESWNDYLERAEGVYMKMDQEVRTSLAGLAQAAMQKAGDEDIAGDPWLNQLDWTPKVAGKTRGIATESTVCSFLSGTLILSTKFPAGCFQ